jgi:hypothetical protein
MTWSQDILLVILAQPACYLFFSALSHRGVGSIPYGPEAAISAVNKKRLEKRINDYEYKH